MKTKFLVAAIFVAGLLLRFLFPGSLEFGFDQVQILDHAKTIAQGKPELIGPRTGPAAMFTGPLIYYLGAAAYLIIANPWCLVLLSLFIYLINFSVITYLTVHYLSRRQGCYFLIIWAVSPLMIDLDRSVWNPNFTFIAAGLVFLPLYHWWNTHRLKTLDYVCLAIGCFLGYQAHFTGLLLPILITACAYPRLRLIGVGLIGTCLSLLPTIIFDLRHRWLNSRGLWQLLTDPPHEQPAASFVTRVWQSSVITLENIGKQLVPNTGELIVPIFGLMIILLSMYLTYRGRLESRRLVLIGLWNLGIIGIFSLYRGAKPAYYYLIAFPSLLVLLSLCLDQVPVWFAALLLTFTGLTSLSTVYQSHYLHPYLPLSAHIQVIETLHTLNQSTGIHQIIIDVPTQYAYGINYLLQDFPYVSFGRVYHLSPNGSTFTLTEKP